MAFGIISCNQDESKLSKPELLTKHSWSLQQFALERTGKPDTLIDVSCAKTDEWSFNINGTYTKVYGGGPQSCLYRPAGFVETGKWRIDGDNFYIVQDFFDTRYPLNEDDHKILQLTEKTLVLADTTGMIRYPVEKYTYKKF